MNTPAVLDDYLMDLLGDVAAAAPSQASADKAPQAEDLAAPAEAVATPLETSIEATAATDDAIIASDAVEEISTAPQAPSAVAVAEVVPEPAPAPAPALAITPVRPGSEAELITDDEFEALLDQLHGSGAPAAPADVPQAAIAPVVAAAAVAAAVAAAPIAAPVHRPPAAPAPVTRAVPPLPIKPYLQAPIDTGERRRATERKTRWLRLRCDQQHYALELLKVQEVVRPATLLPLRGAAHHMLGVMNLRGQVVPVIDMGLYLGRRAIETDASTRVVVLEENGETLGLRVTAVEDVANLADQQIEPPDNARVGRITNPLFRGVARLQERAVILLDASQLLK